MSGEDYQTILLSPPIPSKGRSYVEFEIINQAARQCFIGMGVCMGTHAYREGRSHFLPSTVALFYSGTNEQRTEVAPPDVILKNTTRTKIRHYRELYADNPDGRLDPLSDLLVLLGCIPLHKPLFTRMAWYIASQGMYEITPTHQPLSSSLFQPYSSTSRVPTRLVSTSPAARLRSHIPFSKTVPSILGDSFVFLSFFCRSVTHKSRIFHLTQS
jgi:hypothetical protein